MASSNRDLLEDRNWLELPSDVMHMILLKLGVAEILWSAQNVCSMWRKLCKDPLMWKSIDMHNLGDTHDMEYDLVKMTKHAVDRSCGQLVDINIEYFGTDDVLAYITDQSDKLRRLRLVYCDRITDEGLSEAAKKLPLLEDLELSNCYFSREALDAVGRYCPLLKSLKLNAEAYRRPHIECDEDAVSIAQHMPQLLHLQCFGNKLTETGLQAIMDSCVHLETLDLRQCFNIDLGGDLGRVCAERLSVLRRPNDSTHDYEFDAEIHDDESFDDDPLGFSDIDFLSGDEYDDYYQFSDNLSDDLFDDVDYDDLF